MKEIITGENIQYHQPETTTWDPYYQPETITGDPFYPLPFGHWEFIYPGRWVWVWLSRDTMPQSPCKDCLFRSAFKFWDNEPDLYNDEK